MTKNHVFNVLYNYLPMFVFCLFHGVVSYSSARYEVPIEEDKQTTQIFAKKCDQYSKLQFKKVEFSLTEKLATQTKPQEFPHMAWLLYENEQKEKKPINCAGSLISERWILTAAHFQKYQIVKWARLGDYDVNSTSDIARPTDYKIIKIVIHPDFDSKKYMYNDIALFRLEKDVEFSAFVRPICLNSDPSLNPAVMVVSGWGVTREDMRPGNTVMSKVRLNNVPVKECNETYSSELDLGILPDSMVCAGTITNGEDACWGFSGSPLQIANEFDENKYLQIGITSFGRGCGEHPGVYTRISKYTKWIKQIVWPKEN